MSEIEDIAEALGCDGEEVAAILLNRLHALAARRGDTVQIADMHQGVALMLSGAWAFARVMHPDEPIARAAYVELLRTHAANVEALT